jgi:two-component system, OmpR family, phosphate regulon sensor histidine kinase PhoR
MRIPQSPRLRLTPYFLVLALPLAVGVWAFGNYAGHQARDRADTQLRASLAASASSYRHHVDSAAQQARVLARRDDVQAAVRRRRAQPLRTLVRRHPHAAFLAAGRVLAGRVPTGAPKRSVGLSDGKRVFGSVVVSVPLDPPLLAQLQNAAGLRPHERLFALSRSAAATGDARIDGRSYRVASAPVAAGAATKLAVAEPRSVVSASEDRARRRVLLAGLAILGGVALAAYALAPTLARSRFAHAQRAQAQQVLSHVGDGVFVVDHGGAISFWNPGAESLTGVPAEHAVGRGPQELFRGWKRQAPPVTPSDGRPVAKTGRYQINGSELWLSVSAVEAPVGAVYAFRDLTEEYRLEEARGDFVATVSHELRTPLASIHGAATTLRARAEQLRPKTRHDLLEVVFEQSERLHHLVDQILLANQLSSGSAHVERRPFDAAAVASAAVEFVQPRLPRNLEIELSVPLSLPQSTGDPDRTRQILVNLLDNAAKYSPNGGRIGVAVAEADGEIRFTVRDEGLGVPRAEQKRIFEKFYRLDAGMSRGVGGSGLGLFIARELVTLMGGRIWVDSGRGAGSTFSFELPVTTPATAAAIEAMSRS